MVYTYRPNFIWMCTLCRLPVAKKPQFLANFDSFGGSCTNPLLLMRAKSGVLEQIQGLHLQAKFHLNVLIVSAPVAKNHNFGQILTFLVASVPTPFNRWGPNLVSYSRPMVHVYLQNFISIGLFCRPVAAKNPNFCRFLPFFGLRHLVMSPIGINLRNLNTGAQQ